MWHPLGKPGPTTRPCLRRPSPSPRHPHAIVQLFLGDHGRRGQGGRRGGGKRRRGPRRRTVGETAGHREEEDVVRAEAGTYCTFLVRVDDGRQLKNMQSAACTPVASSKVPLVPSPSQIVRESRRTFSCPSSPSANSASPSPSVGHIRTPALYTFRALPHLSKTRLYFLSSAQIGKESTLLYVDIEDTGGAPATGDQG